MIYSFLCWLQLTREQLTLRLWVYSETFFGGGGVNQQQLFKYLVKNLVHQEDKTYFISCHKFLKLSLNTKLSTSSTKPILYSET